MHYRRFVISVLLTAMILIQVLVAAASAQRLPIRVFTSADGLARDTVLSACADSRGFLWFATVEGVSRYDGYEFRNYGLDRGLPYPVVMAFVETRAGAYWAGTRGNVCSFDPRPNAAPAGSGVRNFSCFQLEKRASKVFATVLREDYMGAVWCGTEMGLYRLALESGRWELRFVDIGMPSNQPEGEQVNDILPMSDGSMWIAAESGLYHRDADGHSTRYDKRHGLPTDAITALLLDQRGMLWAGSPKGLSQLVARPATGRQMVAVTLTTKDGLTSNHITTLFQSSDGLIRVGTRLGLSEIREKVNGGFQVEGLSHTQGFGKFAVNSVVEDREGNIWVGGEASGVIKMLKGGFATWRVPDGLAEPHVESILETKEGELTVINASYDRISLNVYKDGRFNHIHPKLPPGISDVGWGWHQISFQDHLGEWWIATGQGLLRYPKVEKVADLATTPPKARYTSREGLSGDNIFRMYEDHNGDIWIGTITLGKDVLSRWDRRRDRIQAFTEADGIPRAAPTAFGEDATGALWIGQYNGGLLRYRDGRFTQVTERDGLPPGQVRCILLDRKKRLWIGTAEGGLVRIDDPAQSSLKMIVYLPANGISSNSIRSLVEDNYGNLYVGTGRGIDRLNPATGEVRHLTTADGLATSEQRVAFRDGTGALWFGTMQGLSRLIPAAEPLTPPPPMLISGLRIANTPLQISEVGEHDLSLPDLSPGQNPFQVDFLGLSHSTAPLKYQYRLEGSGIDWSPPDEHRTITLANLAPGSYRFAVRAISAAGVISESPASISFRILPPIWRRWWFLMLGLLLTGMAIAALVQYRTGRLLEIERMRTRIAADLHDDIGASLARIAILSEAVRHHGEGISPRTGGMLGEIAKSAQALLDSMGDIVWSIDPRLDDLNHLISRVRQFASDVLSTQGIEWELNATPDLAKLKLGPETRRQLFLILKEAITNIARHSDCRSAGINLSLERNRFVAEIADDGKGIAGDETRASGGGNGLRNMKARAMQLGGELTIGPNHGLGTRVILKVPLER